MFITGISLYSGVILVIFSMLLLLKKSPAQRANRFLSMAFICMAGLNFLLLYLHTALSRESDFLLTYYFPLDRVLVMLLGPILYFYVLLLFDSSVNLLKKHIPFHVLPVLPALAYVIYFATLPVQNRIRMLMTDSASMDGIAGVLNILFYIQSGVYFFLIFLKVNKYRQSGYILKSNGLQTDIRWLHYFFCFALAGLLIYIPFCSVQSLNPARVPVGMSIIDILVIYLFIQSVCKTGLSMQYLPKEPRVSEHKLIIEEKQAENYFNVLLEMMDATQIYLLPECTIKDVAVSTNIPQHLLSNVINSYSNKNFSSFINKYRVVYSTRLLDDNGKRNLTLKAIAFECGFGSRSNFYRAFKKVTGITPTEYLLHTVKKKKTIDSPLFYFVLL